ncbi:hypothetical protein [Desulfogranum japonicum]|uniref:hypothetical protein n=1 Tax=Desulfogranum japonicum TaxID=231447 RepID=UPI00048D0635|nr:hypothetical protein [Desulfogranum japonicum]
MNKKRLFTYLKTQSQSKLLEMLQLAFDTMDTNQRHDVFGGAISEAPTSSVDGEEVLATIEEFYEKSVGGYYYAPFDINSKNFSDIPEETDAWFDEISDYLEDSSKLTDQRDHDVAVQCFKLLHKLIDKMEDGEEIVFADEYGTWMITGDEKRFIKSYLTSLSAILTPEEYANGAIPLIKRDSYESFHNKVYAIATKIANEDQRLLLKRKVKKQGIKTRAR